MQTSPGGPVAKICFPVTPLPAEGAADPVGGKTSHVMYSATNLP